MVPMRMRQFFTVPSSHCGGCLNRFWKPQIGERSGTTGTRIKKPTFNICLFFSREAPIKRVLRQHHDALIVQSLHDLVTDGGFPGSCPACDTDEERFGSMKAPAGTAMHAWRAPSRGQQVVAHITVHARQPHGQSGSATVPTIGSVGCCGGCHVRRKETVKFRSKRGRKLCKEAHAFERVCCCSSSFGCDQIRTRI
jgi:hypothetical protein